MSESDVFRVAAGVQQRKERMLALWMEASGDRGWLWHEALAEGYSVEDVASMAADGFYVPGRKGLDRVPDMYVPPTTVAHRRDAALFRGKYPAPTQAPRVEIAVGDSVAWTTAGAGKVAHTFDAIDNTRIAVVHPAGWFVTPDGYLTRTDTGVPAALEIVAADLTRKVGV